MKGKSFLLVSMVVFFTFCFLLAPNPSISAQVTLKLAHVAPPNTTYDNAALKLAEGVSKYTKGKVEIKIYGINYFEGYYRLNFLATIHHFFELDR